jgi:transmembrane 9 superfamily protein 2/4
MLFSYSLSVRTNQIPRAIPEQQWYMHPVVTCMLAGLLPFGAVSVELYFIMSALWLHQIYYIFGFLFLVMIVLLVTCAGKK